MTFTHKVVVRTAERTYEMAYFVDRLEALLWVLDSTDLLAGLDVTALEVAEA